MSYYVPFPKNLELRQKQIKKNMPLDHKISWIASWVSWINTNLRSCDLEIYQPKSTKYELVTLLFLKVLKC